MFRAVALVPDCSGGDIGALHQALRITVAGFARVADLSVRTTSKWGSDPGVVPRNAVQARLDELFVATSPAIPTRLARFTKRQPGGPSLPGEAIDGNRMVSAVGRLRYAADFRERLAAQVLTPRSALGLTPGEFADWRADA